MQDTPICRTNSDGFFSLVSQNIHFLSSKKNRQIALMQDSDVQIAWNSSDFFESFSPLNNVVTEGVNNDSK